MLPHMRALISKLNLPTRREGPDARVVWSSHAHMRVMGMTEVRCVLLCMKQRQTDGKKSLEKLISKPNLPTMREGGIVRSCTHA
jgi:hypothetical protein